MWEEAGHQVVVSQWVGSQNYALARVEAIIAFSLDPHALTASDFSSAVESVVKFKPLE